MDETRHAATPEPEEEHREPGRWTVEPALGAAASLALEREVQRALRLVHRWLRYRPRTEVEVQRALEQRGFSQDVITAALARARAWGWLDDHAFARLWVEQRQRARPRARWVLERELARRGVPQEAIQAALEGVQDQDLLQQALQRALRRYRGLPESEARRKIVAYLRRRGFGFEAIEEALEHIPWNANEEREP